MWPPCVHCSATGERGALEQEEESGMARGVNDYFLVEGHRDNFELTARRRKGDRCPLAAWLPRLQRAGMNVSVIALGGDAMHHRDGDARPLEGSLDVLDMFLN